MIDRYFYNNPLPMWVYDQKTYRFLDVNNAASQQFGYSRDEFLSMHITDILLSKDQQSILDQQYDRRGSEISRYLCKDGSVITTEVVFQFLETNGLKAVLAVAIAVDERFRPNRFLRESEERLRTLMNSTIDIIFTLDRDQRHTGVFGPWVERAGLTAETFLGKTAREILGDQAAEVHEAANLRALNGEDVIYEWSESGLNGIQYYQTALSPLRNAEGIITGIVGIGRNFTPQKQIEAALREMARFTQSTVDALSAHIAILDEDGTIIAVNRAWRQFAADNHPDPERVCEGANYLSVCDTASGPSSEGAAQMAEALRAIIRGEQTEFMQEYPCHSPNEKRWFISRVTQFDGEGPIRVVVAHENITHRKLAEQTLLESETALKKAHQVAHLGSWTWYIQENRVEWSDEMFHIFGIDKETFNGNLADVIAHAIHPDDREAVERSNLAVIHDKNPQPLEYRVVWPDGTVRTVWGEAGELTLDDSGQALVLTGIVQDITERKKSETALQESNQRYRDIFNGVQDAIFVESLDGRILDVNDRACEMYGYSRSEFLTKTVADLVPKDRLIVTFSDEKILPSPIETVNVRANGECFPVDINGRIQTVNGEEDLLIIIRDITERKAAEEKIRQRIHELEAINRVSIALRASTDQQQMISILLDEILKVFKAQDGAVSLWNPDRNVLYQVVGRGWLDIPAEPILPGEGIRGKVFSLGKTHISREFASDPIASPESRKTFPSGWGGACVPIRSTEENLGILVLAVPKKRVLQPDEIRLLETLAEMAGVALHRMNLHADLRRHLERMQSLRQIDNAITGSYDHTTTLNIIIEQAISQLGVSAADILLLNPNSQTLEFAAGQGFQTPRIQTAKVPVGKSFAGKAVFEGRMIKVENQFIASQNISFFPLWHNEGFTTYYGMPLIAKGQVKGVLEVYHRSAFTPTREWLDFLETLAGQAAIALENAELIENLQTTNTELIQAYQATIEGWARAMSLRDHETEEHSKRVTNMTLRLARAMGISEQELIHIQRGALLHDIGKMGIPDNILLKPEPLTDEEWEIMKKHPQLAYEMLKPIRYLQPATDIPYFHHEKWDGSGYPCGLKGEEIPLSARIFAVVDVWDALISSRPYRSAWKKEKAIEYIRAQSGIHFDPQVVTLFLELIRQDGEAAG